MIVTIAILVALLVSGAYMHCKVCRDHEDEIIEVRKSADKKGYKNGYAIGWSDAMENRNASEEDKEAARLASKRARLEQEKIEAELKYHEDNNPAGNNETVSSLLLA